MAQPPACKRCELRDRSLGDRLEPARLGGENDAESSPVVRVALAPYQSLPLEQADHGRDRLLAQPGAAGELPIRRPSSSYSGTSSDP